MRFWVSLVNKEGAPMFDTLKYGSGSRQSFPYSAFSDACKKANSATGVVPAPGGSAMSGTGVRNNVDKVVILDRMTGDLHEFSDLQSTRQGSQANFVVRLLHNDIRSPEAETGVLSYYEPAGLSRGSFGDVPSVRFKDSMDVASHSHGWLLVNGVAVKKPVTDVIITDLRTKQVHRFIRLNRAS